jgi:hypothetical protein
MKKSLLLLVLMLLMGAQITVNANNNGIFYYTLDGSSASILGIVDNYEGDLIIPSEIVHEGKTYTVRTIYDAYNSSCNLTSITIPSSVTSIRWNAFDGCIMRKDKFINNSKLTSSDNWRAILYDEETNDGLLISDDVVVYCRKWATSVTIPSGVKAIDKKAFENCKTLTSITIPESVTSIGEYAFNGCKDLTSVTLPENLTNIENRTFCDCESLTTINIPNNAKSIGDGAFYNCQSLTNITIPNRANKIGSSSFYNCSNITSVSIPESVTSIGGSAFEWCTNLKSVTISGSVKEIGSGAFASCASLKEVYCYAKTVPNGKIIFKVPSLTSSDTPVGAATLYIPIGSVNLYKGNSNWNIFGSITPIPAANTQDMPVSGIQNSGCLSGTRATDEAIVSTITFLKEGNILTVNLHNFISNCATEDFEITPKVSDGVGDDPCSVSVDIKPICKEEADCICPYNVSFTIHDLETNNFFFSCWWFKGEINLTEGESLTLDDAPGEICIDNIKYALDKVNHTAQLINGKEYNGDIIIPSELEYKGFKYTVTSIGDYAFRGGGGITSVIIPESVTSIGVYAFNKCGGLTSINIPDGVKVLKETFEDCGQITTVTIGSGIKKIDNAFHRCTSITSFYCYAEEVPELIIHGIAFFGENHNMTLYVPAQSVDLYKKTGQWPKRFEYIKPMPQPVNFTQDQMATIIMPTDPDPELGKYYRLDRRQNNLIVFEEEHAPKAHVPYIILPKKDFVIDLSTLDLEGCYRDSVFADGITFIGSFVSEEVECAANCYIDIIDLTPDCHEDIFCEKKAIIGALRAFLRVDTHWEDPYNPGGTRSIAKQEKLQIVLHDNNDASAINDIPQEETVNGKPTDGTIYDLTGRKVNCQLSTVNYQLPKGIYIKNGKKILIK